uniref:EF-hand domain-containing protein n=1 Tax=Bursaphelenchus xylophilus TaxID=6326 RepID=A0A1I7ST02_BURXY
MVLGITAPPPNRQQAQEQEQKAEQAANDQQKPMYEFAYSKYLEQVIKILESDPKFQERVRGMNENDIKEGKIADHIDDLSPEVFSELTKAKLQEIERLREQINEDIKVHGDPSKIPVPEHIDVYNWEKFHKEDLRKLIQKTVSHMEEIDKQRKEKFKEYEMKKKAEEDHKLAKLPPDEREKEKQKIEDAQKRHKEHEKVKHPGGREQLEEVWEESDHMEKDNFDPRTFFALHDLNGDGYWNDDELEALFQIELSKLYNETDPDDDPREKVEEMYRMREHVVKQMDKNNDRLISLQEFLQDSEATTDDNKDEGWKDLADQDIYSEDELKKFEEEYAKQQDRKTQGGFEGQQPIQPVNGQMPPQQQAYQQPPQQQVYQQPSQQQVHQQPPPVQPQQVHPQQVNQPPQPNQVPVQKVPKAVDPQYGI